MQDGTVHRKRIKHYEIPGHAHALTWSCSQHRRLLNSPDRKNAVIEAINRACRRHGFRNLAYVIMPDHVHLIVRHPEPEHSISDLLYAIKKPASFRFKQEMLAAGDPMLAELMVRERPNKQAFRFWQEGPGYDRNIFTIEALRKEIQYLHMNPVRKGYCDMPEDWEWSSARMYAERRRVREVLSRD